MNKDLVIEMAILGVLTADSIYIFEKNTEPNPWTISAPSSSSLVYPLPRVHDNLIVPGQQE